MARYFIAAWSNEVAKAAHMISTLGGELLMYRPDLMKLGNEPAKPVWEIETSAMVDTLLKNSGTAGGYEFLGLGKIGTRTQPIDPNADQAASQLGLKKLGVAAAIGIGAVAAAGLTALALRRGRA